MTESMRVLDIPSGLDRRVITYALMHLCRDLAESVVRDGDQEVLEYLARSLKNVANDLEFAASEAGAAQRRRAAEQSTEPSVETARWAGRLRRTAA